MSSAALQIIALVTMLIDHIGYRLFPGVEPLRIIGRISFPLFAFMLVEGFIHTKGRWRYLGRLTLFAAISEIPYKIFSRGGRLWLHIWGEPLWNNVFFELMLIFIAVWSIQAALEKNKIFFVLTGLCLVLAGLMGTMYGVYGILMGICFYIFRKDRLLAAACLIALTILYCLQNWSLFQIWAILAAVPIWFYNGKRGPRLPKYFGYIFYPAHLLVICAIHGLIA